MPIVLKEYGLAFFSIPKVASTSLKQLFYRLEHRERYKKPDGTGPGIHDVYASRPLGPLDYANCADLWKFTVLRDPIARILSCYSNRIAHRNNLEGDRQIAKDAARLGISIRPDLNSFCEQLDLYCELSRSIRHHTAHFSEFIGDDLSRLDAVFRLEDIGDVAQEIAKRTGRKLKLPHRQKGGPKFQVNELSPAALQSLIDFTAIDYQLLKGLYIPPSQATG